jgi:hypothetical protein
MLREARKFQILWSCDRSQASYVVTVIGHIKLAMRHKLGQVFLVGAGPVGVISLDRPVPFVRVSLFSGDVEAAVQPVDLEHLIGREHPFQSQPFDVTCILPSGNRSMVKVTLSEVASFSMTRSSRKGPSYTCIWFCRRKSRGVARLAIDDPRHVSLPQRTFASGTPMILRFNDF